MGNTYVQVNFKRSCAQWYNLTCIYPGRETPPWVADASPSRDRYLHLPAHTSCSQNQAWVVWDQEDHRDICPASPCAATSRGSLEFSHQVQPTHLLHIRGNNAEPWTIKKVIEVCFNNKMKDPVQLNRYIYWQTQLSAPWIYSSILQSIQTKPSDINNDMYNKLQDMYWLIMNTHHGPLARYAKLGVRMRRECRERFPRHRGWAIPTCITARAWRTCRDACRDR